MKLQFDATSVAELHNFKGGEKSVLAQMYADELNRILIRAVLIPGASIGWHTHENSSEVIYVLSGSGKMLYDYGEERLTAGDCHYCPKGHSHSFINDGEEDVAIFAVVPNQ